MPDARRVAITGLGSVSALGIGSTPLWQGVRQASSGIGPIRTIPTEHLAVRTAAEIPGYDHTLHFDPRQVTKLDRVSQFALLAAREAMQHAALDQAALARVVPQRCGVVLGAGLGQETVDGSCRALYGDGVRRLPPMTVPRGMPSAATSHVSMEFGIRGPCFATASACASATHAIGLAFQMIRAGMLDIAVTGGSDASINFSFLKAWESLRVLSPDTCRPFSRDREGLVIGEGAGILVLEEWQRAHDRDAVILAELIGFGMSADAGDLTAPDASGAARAMQAALDDCGLSADSIDYINAHGTGTRLNDVTETMALNTVFGSRARKLPVSSSKSMLGHCMNAAGALELVVTVLALRDGILPPTAGFRQADPQCDIDCVPNQARPAPIGAAMSNSFAFGGLNAVLVLQRAA